MSVQVYSILVSTLAHIILIAYIFHLSLFGCWLPEDGDQPKHVAHR